MILKAAGEGRASGRTGTVTEELDGAEEEGNLGSAVHCATSTMSCTGNMIACSFEEPLEAEMASMCVG